MEPLERAAVLLTLMRELQHLMKRENALLREMQLGRLAELQADKATLAEAYEMELRAFRISPELHGGAAVGGEAASELALREFQRAVRLNLNALRTGRDVVERLVRRIGQSMGAAERGQAYRPGQQAGGAPATAHIIPLAVDRRI